MSRRPRVYLSLVALGAVLSGCSPMQEMPAESIPPETVTEETPPPEEVEEIEEVEEMTEKQTTPAGAVAAVKEFIQQQNIDTDAARWKTKLPKPTQVTFTEGTTYFWNLTTSEGEITVKLFPEVAPMHVTSTIYLTELGFYDGLSFHRVITKFMAQGGCPLGTGTGSPGYKYDGEFDESLKHDKPGMLSMANSGPGTDGSQFFLTFVPTAHLDGKHTIFGEVVGGMDVVKTLESHGSGNGKTDKPLSIVKATISTDGD